jgi:membrane protease YdiL (CAAX protease family)
MAGTVAIRTDITRAEWIIVIDSLILAAVAGFGEEFGWRGYLMPRMMDDARPGTARSSLYIVGVIWGCWHWPIALGPLLRSSLIDGPSSPAFQQMLMPTLVQCLLMVGAGIGLSVVFGTLWLATRNIIFLSFVHGYYTAIRDITSVFFPVSHMRSAIGVVIALICLVACWLWLHRYERKKSLRPQE